MSNHQVAEPRGVQKPTGRSVRLPWVAAALLLAGSLIGGTLVWAAWPETDTVPFLMPYSGVLEVTGGTPTAADLAFALFVSDTPDGDDWDSDAYKIWGPEEHLDVAVANGRFAVTLGDMLALDESAIGHPTSTSASKSMDTPW